MRKAILVINSVVGGALLTTATAVITLLYLMFSVENEEKIHQTGLFGSLYFASEDKTNGTTSVTMGVDNPTALIIAFVVLTAFTALFQLIYRSLKSHRAQLIHERSNV